MCATVDAPGLAQISLAGLDIWVHRRQFPDHDDYWDGNWLVATVRCRAPGAEVWIRDDPCLHLSELRVWHDAAAEMHRTLAGEAVLACMEPLLSVEPAMRSLGDIAMTVRITPEHLTQQHVFEFVIDQSYLPALLAQCRAVFADYPIRGRPVPEPNDTPQ